MKKWLVVLVAIALFQNRACMQRAVHGPPKLTQDQVILYSTAYCGYCKLTRELLAEHHVPYTDLDIDTSATAREQLEHLTGSQGVPVLVVKGEVIPGYNKEYMLSALYQ